MCVSVCGYLTWLGLSFLPGGSNIFSAVTVLISGLGNSGSHTTE